MHPLISTRHHSIQHGSGLIVRVLLSGLLLLTAVPGAATGVQLCLGEGGHIELEARGACGRLAAGSSHASPFSVSETEADDCDPCVDFTLDAGVAHKVEAALPSSFASLMAGLNASLPVLHVGIPAICSSPQPLAASPPDPAKSHVLLAAIRTVILLI